MDENKRTAKGIKLNASQLPLSNKADFVIGADSRKVLDNKIIENLGNTGSHGYFPSTAGRGYKSWSVSRELEIPSLPEDAEAQMRMIEGASAAVPLQNEFGSAASSQSDPSFRQGGEADSNPFAHEPMHPENPFESHDSSYVQSGPNPYEVQQPNPVDVQKPNPLDQPPPADPGFGAGSSFADQSGDRNARASQSTPAADPLLASQLQDTFRETLPMKAPSSTPSPWSGPVTDQQTPAVVRQHLPQSESQQWTESPWAGPVTDKQLSMEVSAEPQAPAVAEQKVPVSEVPGPSSQGEIIPSWISAMASEVTASGESPEASGEAVNAASTPVGEEVALETFLNSIPDEEFVIDNETMRHLFSSLCEPKSNSLKIKSPARDAANLAIAAAAAEILNTEVSIDDISIDDIATEEVLAVEVSADADFEAIQQAYAMLDLSPLPVSQRKEGSFDNVFDVVEKAAEEQILRGEQVAAVDASANVSRTERGTIEMAIHAGGRQLVPQYNFCGMLTGVEMSDGLSFVLSEEKNTWQLIEQTGKVMVSGIKSVSFDKQGNLSYVTKRGDTVTLKVDGTIDTKFAKKVPADAPLEVVEIEAAPVAKTAVKAVKKTPATPVAKTPKKPAVKEVPARVKQAKPAAKNAPKPKKKSR